VVSSAPATPELKPQGIYTTWRDSGPAITGPLSRRSAGFSRVSLVATSMTTYTTFSIGELHLNEPVGEMADGDR